MSVSNISLNGPSTLIMNFAENAKNTFCTTQNGSEVIETFNDPSIQSINLQAKEIDTLTQAVLLMNRCGKNEDDTEKEYTLDQLIDLTKKTIKDQTDGMIVNETLGNENSKKFQRISLSFDDKFSDANQNIQDIRFDILEKIMAQFKAKMATLNKMADFLRQNKAAIETMQSLTKHDLDEITTDVSIKENNFKLACAIHAFSEINLARL